MRRSAFVVGLGSVVLANALPAQRVLSSLDLSGTGVWYADTVHSTGSSLSPAIRVDWSRATISAFGNLSRVGGGISAQGSLNPSLFTPNIGPVSGEFAASLGGSAHPDGTRTGQSLAIGRAYFSQRHAGAWLGLGAGATWDGALWRDVRQTEAGLWMRSHELVSLATVTPVVVADSIRYTDFQAAARYPWSSYEVGVTAGARSGSVGAAIGGTSRVWGSLSATMWLSSSLAIVGSAGSYPVDLTQGYPGGRFVTLALRIASRNTRAVQRAEDAASAPVSESREPTATPAPASDFEAVSTTGTRRVLRLRAPSAHAVEINADFTGWQPVPFKRETSGIWTVVLTIPSGAHQFNIRVDGGPWLVPPGVLSTRDEFGGVVGILSIE
jgi:hypothetical protein